MGNARSVVVGALVITILVGLFVDASAERFTGGSYTIDASVIGNSFGGDTTGGSYKLTSSGGESVVGQGSGGSYRLDSGYVAQLQSSLQLTIQPGGMLLYYALNEPSGTFVRDSSINANNGNTISSPTWTSGRVDGGVSLNGSSQYVTGPDVDSATNITISAWVNPSASHTSSIVSKHSSTSDNQGRLSLASNTPSFTITTGGTQRTATAGSAIPSSSWSHIVGTYDGSNARLYVNGVQAGISAGTGAIATNAFAWTVGRDANASSNYFNGVIDEVKVLSRALTLSEVDAEYDAGVAGNQSGLSFATEIVPGISQTSDYDAAVLTDASKGYNLSVNQNQNLTNGGNTISPVSGSIASPVSWVEGTTKGLGFTLFGTNATAIPGKWSSGSSYAAFPGSATSYYVRTGKASSKDILNMRLRLDVPTTQVSGAYTNVITTTGTITP